VTVSTSAECSHALLLKPPGCFCSVVFCGSLSIHTVKHHPINFSGFGSTIPQCHCISRCIASNHSKSHLKAFQRYSQIQANYNPINCIPIIIQSNPNYSVLALLRAFLDVIKLSFQTNCYSSKFAERHFLSSFPAVCFKARSS